MFKSDSDQFYRFLKDVCDLFNRGYHVVGFKELIEFFQEQVFSNTADEQVYAQMTPEGFSSISSFFTMLNHQEGKILRLLP
jgi:phage/plasmid-associated DNA primase